LSAALYLKKQMKENDTVATAYWLESTHLRSPIPFRNGSIILGYVMDGSNVEASLSLMRPSSY
jgi:hypothetical protein